MDLLGQLGGLLQQYAGASPQQAPANVHNDFDKVAEAAPHSSIADGLAAAFRSNQTPAFGQMLGQLFANSNGEQRANVLNTLLSSAGPGVLSSILGGAGLGNLLNAGATHVTPQQAEQVSPQAVEQAASQVEQHNPGIVDRMSEIYAQHPGLVKTLGGAALTIALAKIANRQAFGS